MSGISHKQVIQLTNRRMDGLLNESQRLLLEEHLRSCDSCRDYANKLDGLSVHLQNEFHRRWDARLGPSQKFYEQVMTKARDIPITNRISSGIKMFASVAALLVLAFLVNFVVSQLHNTPPAATKTVNNLSQSDSRLIAFTSTQYGNSDIYTVHIDGSELTNLTNNPAEDVNPVWSPDGRHIAFVSNRDGNNNIYLMNADGSNLTRLTDDPLSDTNPVWSPNGTKIAYASGDFSKNNTNIFVMDSNGQNHRQLTNYVPNTTVWPEAWSPDSQFVLFDVYRKIVQIGINEGEVTSLTPQTDVYVPSNFVLSADGSKLTYLAECDEGDRGSNDFCNMVKIINRYATNEEAKATLKIQEVCSLKQSTTWMGRFTKWSPDQTKLLFAFTCNDNGWLYVANADGSDFKPLTSYPILGNGPQNEIVTFDWSPDSQSIVFISALDIPESESLYILNVNAVLQNPEIRPTPVTTSISQASSPVWQPNPDSQYISPQR